MLFFHKKPEKIVYNPDEKKPAVRKSICTGEMTAGFVDTRTGKFQDFMLLKDQKALENFCEQTGVKRENLTEIY